MKCVGVIGAGSFGIALSKLLSHNIDVLIYSRRQEVIAQINTTHHYHNVDLDNRIIATNDMEQITSSCELLFIVVPSSSFRELIKAFSPFLKPSHIIIQCTKGLDVSKISDSQFSNKEFKKQDVCTMSEVIRQESSVIRVGCLSGPNLAQEILAGQPAATVIASEFDEVIKIGQKALNSKKLYVFGSNDLKAAEIAGAFKNIIALASGILAGKGYGKNLQSLLITRGLREMIYFGNALGCKGTAFLGVAGIGDLIATATSEDSRNFSFGKRLGKGEDFDYILNTSSEVVEGIRTLHIVNQLAKNENIVLPIVQILYHVIFEQLDMDRALDILMSENYSLDVDFI